jgi:predicted NAD/FAD-dependent oxidoreductase
MSKTITGDEWNLMQRVVLAGPAPSDAQGIDRESRRFREELEGALSRISQSWHLRKLREAGLSLSELLRGADMVLVGAGQLFDVFAQIGGRAAEKPFAHGLSVEMKDFGTLYFAKDGNDCLVRLQAPVAQLRKIAPILMTFFHQHVVREQNVGPMGCSPCTFDSGNPVRVS